MATLAQQLEEEKQMEKTEKDKFKMFNFKNIQIT